MPRPSEMMKEFREDMSVVRQYLEGIGGICIRAQGDMEVDERKLRQALESGDLTPEQRTYAELSYRLIADCKTLVGGWVSLGGLAKAMERDIKPGADGLCFEDLRPLQYTLIEALVWYTYIKNAALSGQLEQVDKAFRIPTAFGRPPKDIESAFKSLRKNLKRIMDELPSEADEEPIKESSELPRFLRNIQTIMIIYLKWVNRALRDYEATPKAKRVGIIKKWNPVLMELGIGTRNLLEKKWTDLIIILLTFLLLLIALRR